MANSTGTAKLAGTAGSLLAGIGTLAFFVGLFGGPRMLVVVGAVMGAAALVAFFVEESGKRRAA